MTGPELAAVPGGESLREAFACFPSGVVAVCALADGAPAGLAASSFTSVSLDPPLVSVCVRRTSTTWPVLRPAARLGISVLAEDQDLLCRQLARKSGNRFERVSWTRDPAGAVFIDGASLWLSCTVEDEVPAGDHGIAVLRIHGLRAEPLVSPLVFHGSTFGRVAS
ncbi:oxidoreductase [Amycolatopsis sp. NBRC 101858]|uniref:flavin reductase family protein n=1 Tax=Amycolatopsis sp. NBRC 101858 TaxID=3032200 RepID=UPI0024A41215|nr:flavin reductase family protein [Amycolatopsis sp. NBRC 101858]GLY38894.1 oxidoreductase [Amycolatopsis sp. NBRC 101858]